MQRCETCGNDYLKLFSVTIEGQTHVFDYFECAIQRLAPVCAHCGCKVIGHGVEGGGLTFCCNHCARHMNPAKLRQKNNRHERNVILAR